MTLADAVTLLQEAERASRKQRDLAQPIADVTAEANAHFRRQRDDFLRRADGLLRIYFEALRDDVDGIWFAVTQTVSGVFARELQAAAAEAVTLGATSGALDLGIDIAVGITHPETLDWLRNRGASRVAMIDATTRGRLQAVLLDSREQGLSWGQASRRISDEFAGFGRQRADLIAVTEMGEAYEQGRLATARSLVADGRAVEKSWLILGANPCEICMGNEAAGWIAHDERFPSGDDVPLAHPRCSCDVRLRAE